MKCPKCEKEYEYSFKFCTNCGEANQRQSTSVELKQPHTTPSHAHAVDYVIPLVKRHASISVEYWALAFSCARLYLIMTSRSSAPTFTLLYGGLIDGILGIKNKRAVSAAQKQSLEEVLSMARGWSCLTPAEIAKTKIRRGPFRFGVMFPEMDGKKKFSLVIWNRYRSGFMEYFSKLNSE